MYPHVPPSSSASVAAAAASRPPGAPLPYPGFGHVPPQSAPMWMQQGLPAPQPQYMSGLNVFDPAGYAEAMRRQQAAAAPFPSAPGASLSEIRAANPGYGQPGGPGQFSRMPAGITLGPGMPAPAAAAAPFPSAPGASFSQIQAANPGYGQPGGPGAAGLFGPSPGAGITLGPGFSASPMGYRTFAQHGPNIPPYNPFAASQSPTSMIPGLPYNPGAARRLPGGLRRRTQKHAPKYTHHQKKETGKRRVRTHRYRKG